MCRRPRALWSKPWSHRREDCIQKGSRFALHRGRYVAVDIEGHARGAVTKTLGNDSRMYASLQEQRGGGVAQRVESQAGQPSAPQEGVVGASQEVAGIDGAAELAGKHK